MRSVLARLCIAAAALAASPALAQTDPMVAEIMRKAAAAQTYDGFCDKVSHWPITTMQSEHQFLENAEAGTAEAARFTSGACSYTQVTQVYPGDNGKCVRYTWWACQPGYTCGTGESLFCKQPGGTFKRLN